jgi:predicted RNA binding protein YcfA (HicA-like mRNA interferase family)
MIKGALKLRISNPHSNPDISPGLVNAILKQAGIDKKDWENA